MAEAELGLSADKQPGEEREPGAAEAVLGPPDGDYGGEQEQHGEGNYEVHGGGPFSGESVGRRAGRRVACSERG